MKTKYIEESFPRYFIFGEHKDGRVDIATSDDSTIATVSREEANKLISDRDELLDALCRVALRLAKVAPDEFTKIWYESLYERIEDS